MEILHQSPINWGVISNTTINDEMYHLYRDEDQFRVKVYQHLQALTAKQDFSLPGLFTLSITACGINNCLYTLNRESSGFSVSRINLGLQFQTSPCIAHLNLPNPVLSVSRNGHLIVWSNQSKPPETILRIYNANGSVTKELKLNPVLYGFTEVGQVMLRDNGNAVCLVSRDSKASRLWELNMKGHVIRKYSKSLGVGACSAFADHSERIVVTGPRNELILLDPEFNVINYFGPNLPGDILSNPLPVAYNHQRQILTTLGLVTRNEVTTPVAVIFCFLS